EQLAQTIEDLRSQLTQMRVAELEAQAPQANGDASDDVRDLERLLEESKMKNDVLQEQLDVVTAGRSQTDGYRDATVAAHELAEANEAKEKLQKALEDSQSALADSRASAAELQGSLEARVAELQLELGNRP
ncbi:unnamed protein product, partial [Effrenium voratum]